jgi:uncharacterized metal-binding protein YceD (DUF177 family)
LVRQTTGMKVYFHEIKDEELSYAFTEDTPWVMEVIGALDEKLDRIPRPPNWKPRSRPTEVYFTLRRVEDLVHVSGRVKTQLFMLCSICADAFQLPINLHFHTLLTQSEIYAEAPRESNHKSIDAPLDPWEAEDEDETSDEFDEDDQFGDHDDSDEDEGSKLGPMNLNSSDFEVTVVTEPAADLKEILHEQIVLIMPMQPKPAVDEDDDCVKCGRKQLLNLPETVEIVAESPFAALKNFKKK